MTNKTKEYRQKLADAFAHVLEERPLDWKKGWAGGNTLPTNARTGNLVSGARGYKDPRWATFNQIKERGWKLHDAKGQGVSVEYWMPYDTEEKRVASWSEYRGAGEPFGGRYQLRVRYSTVFNAELIDGIPALPKPEVHDVEPDELVGVLSRNMGVEIENDGGDRAFYRPSEDRIHLPFPETFFSSYAYASTALHELAHSTGAPHRLGRNLAGTFGTPEYAYEELVAEITSCFMSVNLDAEQDERHVENHKAYVQSWAGMVRDDPEVLVRAVRQAEQAAGYMEYKAELIPVEEYEKISQSTVEAEIPGETIREKRETAEAATGLPDEGVPLERNTAASSEKTDDEMPLPEGTMADTWPGAQGTSREEVGGMLREVRKEIGSIRDDTRYLNDFMDAHGISHGSPERKEVTAIAVTLEWNVVHETDDEAGHPTEWSANLPGGGFLRIDKEGDTRYALYDVPDVEPISIAVTLDEAQENGEEYAERMLAREREWRETEEGEKEDKAMDGGKEADPSPGMEDMPESGGILQKLAGVTPREDKANKVNKELNLAPRR